MSNFYKAKESSGSYILPLRRQSSPCRSRLACFSSLTKSPPASTALNSNDKPLLIPPKVEKRVHFDGGKNGSTSSFAGGDSAGPPSAASASSTSEESPPSPRNALSHSSFHHTQPGPFLSTPPFVPPRFHRVSNQPASHFFGDGIWKVGSSSDQGSSFGAGPSRLHAEPTLSSSVSKLALRDEPRVMRNICKNDLHDEPLVPRNVCENDQRNRITNLVLRQNYNDLVDKMDRKLILQRGLKGRGALRPPHLARFAKCQTEAVRALPSARRRSAMVEEQQYSSSDYSESDEDEIVILGPKEMERYASRYGLKTMRQVPVGLRRVTPRIEDMTPVILDDYSENPGVEMQRVHITRRGCGHYDCSCGATRTVAGLAPGGVLELSMMSTRRGRLGQFLDWDSDEEDPTRIINVLI